jgi:hypothetical protein
MALISVTVPTLTRRGHVTPGTSERLMRLACAAAIDAAATAPADVVTNAASSLVSGGALESAVTSMVEMGFAREEVRETQPRYSGCTARACVSPAWCGEEHQVNQRNHASMDVHTS